MLTNSTRTVAPVASGLLAAAWLVAGCTEPITEPGDSAGQPSARSAAPSIPGSASERQLYQVRLGATEGHRSHGVMRIEVVGGQLVVTVHAANVPRSQRIPQHIHVNPTCNPGGLVLINLDDRLTVRGEAPGVGDAYPMSNQGGVVNYRATRSLTDLRAAVNVNFDTTLTSDAELLDWLNLEERNAHMHIPQPPSFPPVNCGELERIN